VVSMDTDPPHVISTTRTRSLLRVSQNSRGVGDSVKFLAARATRKRNEGGPHGFFAAKVLIASPRREREGGGRATLLRQRVRAENGKALADQRHYANSGEEANSCSIHPSVRFCRLCMREVVMSTFAHCRIFSENWTRIPSNALHFYHLVGMMLKNKRENS
jgi:hypothetical protein